MTPLPMATSPNPGGLAWDLAARVTLSAGDEGVLYASGNENSGVSAFVQGDRLVVDYNAFGRHTVLESECEVPVGESVLGIHLRRIQGYEGELALSINGTVCGSAKLPLMMMMASSIGSSIGEDHGSPVSERYASPFTFSGTLHEIDIEMGNRSTAEDAARARAEMSRQ